MVTAENHIGLFLLRRGNPRRYSKRSRPDLEIYRRMDREAVTQIRQQQRMDMSPNQQLADLIYTRIRDFPGAKFNDIFDLSVVEACRATSGIVHYHNLFRIADSTLQALRKQKKIEYRRGGWYITNGPK